MSTPDKKGTAPLTLHEFAKLQREATVNRVTKMRVDVVHAHANSKAHFLIYSSVPAHCEKREVKAKKTLLKAKVQAETIATSSDVAIWSGVTTKAQKSLEVSKDKMKELLAITGAPQGLRPWEARCRKDRRGADKFLSANGYVGLLKDENNLKAMRASGELVPVSYDGGIFTILA